MKERSIQMQLYIGILLFLSFFVPLFIPEDLRTGLIMSIFFAAFCMGVTYISDWYIKKETGESLFKKIMKRGRNKNIFLLTAIVAGLLLDVFVIYIGALWYLPYYPPVLELVLIFAGAYAVYFFPIIFGYEAVKLLLDKWRSGRKVITKHYKFEARLFHILFIVGLTTLLYALTRIIVKFIQSDNFQLVTHLEKEPVVALGTIVAVFFGLWFIFEFIEFKRRGTSFIDDILHGYWIPLIAIVASSAILALFMELWNVPLELWVYSRVPFNGTELLRVPVWVWITWPLHVLAFLSMYRAFGTEPPAKFWQGDVIK